MSKGPFFALLFFVLLLFCRTPALAYEATSGDSKLTKSVAIFLPNCTYDQITSEKEKRRFSLFLSPVVVEANGLMVALSVGFYTNQTNQTTDIIAKYIDISKNDLLVNITQESMNKTDSVLIFPKTVGEGNTTNVTAWNNLLAVGRGDKIYLLAVNSTMNITGPANSSENIPINLEFIVGTVTNSSSSEAQKSVSWVKKNTVVPQSGGSSANSLSEVVLYDGSAFATKNGAVMFFLRALVNDNDVFWVVYCNGTDSTDSSNACEMTNVTKVDGCFPQSSFLWREKLTMLLYCANGKHVLRELTDKGKTWKSSSGPISRLWDYLLATRDFTTVSIDGRDVLLFTEQRVTGSVERSEIYLWVSDGNRAQDVGPIVAYEQGDLASSGLLYTRSELFFVHQQFYGPNSTAFLTHLRDQLGRVRFVLNAWREADKAVMRLCEDATSGDTSPNTLCGSLNITEGIVGFLSGRGNETHWHNEYLYVNATVTKGGKKVANGFEFSGQGVGARWPVGEQGPNQLYNFARHGFTLIATVTVHSLQRAGVGSPLLGVSLGNIRDGDVHERHVGLWCGVGGSWAVSGGAGTGFTVTNGTCEAGGTYQIVLTLQGGSVLFYVDWRPLEGVPNGGVQVHGSESVLHFYFGADCADPVTCGVLSDVTVGDVLLYNRPFTAADIGVMKMKKNAPSVTARLLLDSTAHVPAGAFVLFVLGLCYLSLFH